jgi:ABC-type polysaccharide/polyol phosphate transport system ATPase subunit
MALNNSQIPVDGTNPISVRNVAMRIPIMRRGKGSLMTDPLSLLASFYKPRKAQREVRTIIEGLSFEVEDGWRLALIGRNGAGKTTLLRLLAGSYHPTRGTIVSRGSIQALLNLSLGFRNSATGLENIYLRGLSMGMAMAEIQEKLPEIAAFTELGDAIHDPIQTYSAGMRAKLGFSIATSRDPSILLMDEWISAGDKFFMAKAQERLQSRVQSCKALVIASHNKNILSDICTHGLVLDSGQSLYFGKIDDALRFYDEMVPAKRSNISALSMTG